MSSWTDWKLSDITWGILIPCLVAFLIIIFPLELSKILLDIDSGGTLTAIFTDGLGEAILTIGIPLFAGLIWNKFAGGAAGFLCGSIYALYVNDTYAMAGVYVEHNFMVGDIANLGFVVAAMLIGFIAGSLNRQSYSFRRMLVAALVAGVIAGVFQLWTGLLSPIGMITDIPYSAFLILLPRLIYGILVPIFVTVFGWFGISPRQMM